MRIGLLSTPWIPVPPTGYGGVEGMVDGLARGFAEAGHDVLLAAPGDSTCSVPRVEASPRSEPDRMGLTLVELRHVARSYAAMRDVDLVHDHTLAGPLYRHRPEGVPVLTTQHFPFTAEFTEFYRTAARDVGIIAISRHQASTAADIPIAAVIHHGIDVDRIPVGRGDGGFALFLGRMNPVKGAREAILIARDAGIPLVIAAKMRSREEREYFEGCVEPLLGDPGAEYLGEVGETEKYALLGQAVALLNPIQWHEPFGLVMVESLASGTPVVGTPRGAAPEIVQDGVTGLLRDTHGDLTEALQLAAEKLDRAACRQDAERRFTRRRMVTDHLRVYEHVLSGAHHGQPGGDDPCLVERGFADRL